MLECYDLTGRIYENGMSRALFILVDESGGKRDVF